MKAMVVTILLTGALLASCGGSDESRTEAEPGTSSTPDSTDQPSDDVSDREGDLRGAATQAMQDFIDGNNAKYYASTTSDFQKKCPLEDFIGILVLGRGFLGDISDAEAVIDDVRFEDSRGFTDGHLELDGTKLDLNGDEEDEYPEYWVLEDGRWKWTSDDPAPCDIGDSDDE